MSQILWIKTFTILIFLALTISMERPRLKSENIKRWIRNSALFLLTGIISALVIVPINHLADGFSSWRDGTLFIYNQPWILLFDLCLLDLWLYFWHRANHKIGFLWRFHEIHHLDTDLDSSTALRFHFGEVMLSALARGIVMIVLDISLLHIIYFEMIVMCAAIFQHSQIKLSTKWQYRLNHIIVTPTYHRKHHYANPIQYHSHFATILPIWDALFRSQDLDMKVSHKYLGVADGRGGVLKDLSFWRLIIRPFYRR